MSEQYDGLREVLKAASKQSEVIQQLIEDPSALAAKFKLSDAERERLEKSDVLLASLTSRRQARRAPPRSRIAERSC